MSVLALHAGTAGVTAMVVGADGRTSSMAHREVARQVPRPGWEEQSPDEVWRSSLEAVRDVLGEADPSEVTAVEVTSPLDTTVLWDRETLGSARPAFTSADRRAATTCERLRTDGHESRVSELTGLTLDPCHTAPRLLWLAQHEPHLWALVVSGRYAVGDLGSYLVTRMTRGTWHVTDVSHASRTLMMEVGADDWSDELCDLFGVPLDALPELVPSRGLAAPTDPTTFLGLTLPISGIAADPG